MDVQYRHNSAGDMYRPYRFELHYDQQTFRPNRPVNARLHQYQHGQSSGSMPSSPLSSRMIYPRAPLSMASHTELRDLTMSDDPYRATESIATGTPRDPKKYQPPKLSRSVSMPVLQQQLGREGRSLRNSRKSSFVSNCMHSREPSVNGSEMSFGSDNASLIEGGSCHRHHHRRGSVAIKFEEKKVVDDSGEKEMHFNENVFDA